MKKVLGTRKFIQGSVAMIIVALITLLLIIPLSMQLLKLSRKTHQQQLHGTVQADNAARAGLIETVAWFQRKILVNQGSWPTPDDAFHPRGTTMPPETMDESIGLVEEYPLNADQTLWIRFEVRHGGAHDITAQRVPGHAAGEGLAWSIECMGFIYRRRNSTVAYNVSPNEVVGRSRASTEIRRIGLNISPLAAATVDHRDYVTCTNNSKISGGTDVGLVYNQDLGGGAAIGPDSSISGNPQYFISMPPPSAGSVFGVTPSELKQIADLVIPNPSNPASLPTNYPNMAIVYVDGDVTFDAAHPVHGGGILYVNGNLTVPADSDALFSGLIFVTGNATIHGPALISGSVICLDHLSLDGSGDVVEINFDNNILNSVAQKLGSYRENKATYFSFSGAK